jgi:Tfp pilus assembly PilM family ATPase
MGFGWVQKNVSPIAIDFGAHSIKLLQVTCDDPPKLLASASIDVPADVRRDGDAHRAFLTTALKDAMRDGRFKGRRAVASLNSAHTHVQHVRIAKAEPAQTASLIEEELRGRIPFYPAGVIVRHVVVGDVFADGQNRVETICFAASREAVLRQVALAKAAGFDIVAMHGDSMAILAAFGHLFRRADDIHHTTLFLDLGAATTKALIAHGPKLVFAKTIHVGGDHLHREPAAAASASSPLQAGAQRSAAPGIATATLASPPAQSEMLETLIDELQLCLGYHASLFTDRSIEKIVFLGGVSRQTDLCQRIAQTLRLPAQLGDPLARVVRPDGAASASPAMNIDLRTAQPGWAVPMGLCLLPTNL